MGVKIREKPKGSGQWWIFISHNGKRKAKKVGRDREQAERVATKAEAAVTLGDLGFMKKQRKAAPTLGDYATLWLSFVEANRRASTYERYSRVLEKHILPVFKNRPLDEITRGQIRNFIVAQSKERQPFIFRDILSSIFRYAIDDEVIKANPVAGILRNIATRKRGDKVDPLNEVDLALFLATAKETYPEYHVFFLTAARTGLRLGELLALRWADISFNHKVVTPGGIEERPYLYVERTYRRGVYTPPKNGKARKVDISLQLKKALLNHRKSEKRKGLSLGLGSAPELVFNRDGRVIEQNYIRRIFKRILEKAGIRDMKLHGLRHTYASLLLSKGISPVYVKEQLGHHSIQITVDIYGRWIQNNEAPAVNRLDDETICNLYATRASK
jgi:integrase